MLRGDLSRPVDKLPWRVGQHSLEPLPNKSRPEFLDGIRLQPLLGHQFKSPSGSRERDVFARSAPTPRRSIRLAPCPAWQHGLRSASYQGIRPEATLRNPAASGSGPSAFHIGATSGDHHAGMKACILQFVNQCKQMAASALGYAQCSSAATFSGRSGRRESGPLLAICALSQGCVRLAATIPCAAPPSR